MSAASSIAATLAPLAAAYGVAMSARASLYRRGWLRSEKAGIPVISIGNIVAGGTGKTPVVALVAGILQGHGMKPAIVSRGYRGKRSSDPMAVSAGDGKGLLSDAGAAGDEPVMLARSLPDVPVIVARQRAAGARLAVDRFGAGCVVLDDGFQHLALRRDLDLVMLDGARPLGNGNLLPSGFLREKPAALRRAGGILLSVSESDPSGNAPEFDEKIRPWTLAGTPVFHIMFKPTELLSADGRTGHPVSWLVDKDVVAFAGIARPERFSQSLLNAGARISRFIPFPDHHSFSGQDVDLILNFTRELKPAGLITTEKDQARLEGTPHVERLVRAGLMSLRGSARIVEEDDSLARFTRLILDAARTETAERR